MQDEYLISVIVPVYNVERYLNKCIESIIHQEYKNLQIILVNDGSIDHSGEICDKYAQSDKRIEVVHKKNGGVVSARKEGLALARGNYIGFVDADDYIDADFYGELLRIITESDVDFVHTGYVTENKLSEQFRNQYEEGICDISDSQIEFIKAYIFGANNGLHMQHNIVSKLFKADLIKRSHASVPECLTRGEDMLCTCSCILNSKRIYLSLESAYHYITRTDSATHCNSIENIIDFGVLYKSFKDLFREYGVLEDVRKELKLFFEDFFISFLSLELRYRNISLYEFPAINMIKGKRIILYCAGKVGQDYYGQMRKYDEISILAWVDKHYEKYNFDYKRVIGTDSLRNYEFDYIIIAVLDKQTADSIKKELIGMGIHEDVIIWEKPGKVLE